MTSGSTTTYTIVVANGGPQGADGAVLTDATVAGLAQTSIGCVASGGAVCPSSPTNAQLQSGLAIPKLPSGGSLTFTVGATVIAASGSVSNTATIAPPGGVTDPDNTNNSATDTDTVTPVAGTADLSVTKTHSGTLTAGATVVYSIVVSNAGPGAASGAIVVDPIATGLNKTGVTCGGATGGAQCPANPTLAQLQSGIAIPVFPTNSSVTFTVTVRVTAQGGTVSNTATITPPPGVSDPVTSDNQTVDNAIVNPGSGGGSGGRGPAEPIPTLDVRGLALLVLGMALIGGWLARRRLSRGRSN